MNAFTITTTKAFTAHEEVYDSYGRKCNTEFFLNYGFVADNNQWNQAKMVLTIPDNDPLRALKLNVVGGFTDKSWIQVQLSTDYQVKEVQQEFSFMRVAMATEAELRKMLGGGLFYRPNTRRVSPVNIRNELEAVQGLAICALDRLQRYDTSVEEDDQLLLDDSLGRNLLNCIKVRRCEKEVLGYYVKLAAFLEKTLAPRTRTCGEIRTLLATAPECEANTNVDFYVKNVLLPLLSSTDSDEIGYLLEQFTHMTVTTH